ncbi:MAG: ATP-binding protein [Muribaculaceae bacterium]|nr:ATP-binding protein [Muribaculaceae bacterium]
MANIYELRRYGKLAFLVAAAGVVAMFLAFSSSLIRDLSAQERERMEIWADATRQLLTSSDLPNEVDDFLLDIIRRNTTIPVLLTDAEGNILQFRNFELPVEGDNPVSGLPSEQANIDFLQKRLAELQGGPRTIVIDVAPGVEYYLYYEDSTLLRRISVFPFVQLLVMLAFIAVVYFAVLSTKKAEQNKVWVGLSKETAHQLGTPISSLMAWMELLGDMGVDADTIAEMNKDVNRLSTIASRFSKIGSAPRLERCDINSLVASAAGYMATRISPKVNLSINTADSELPVEASAPLLEWVIENLVKNAVDAMEGHGDLSVTVLRSPAGAAIEVTDTGKGISRKNFKTVFNPGYTTKSRGWGLGLTLAKRIIEQYHNGHIFVARSIPFQATTFRIELPVLG